METKTKTETKKTKEQLTGEKIKAILEEAKMELKIVQGINPNGTIGATLKLIRIPKEEKKTKEVSKK